MMKPIALAITCLLFIAGTGAVAADGSDGSEASSPAAVESRVQFTEEQADRGRSSYMAHCAECHGLGLNGGMGPALTRDVFMQSWGSRTVGALLEVVSTTMPRTQPGGLDDQTYVDIVTHILARNGHTPGDSELQVDSPGLGSTQIRPDPQ